MSEDFKLIKRIDPAKCPHCGKDFFISSQSMPSCISNISTPKEMEETKKKIVDRAETEIKFASIDEQEAVLKWLEDEDTLLDSSDIEPLIKQIQIQQLEKIQKNDKENKNTI